MTGFGSPIPSEEAFSDVIRAGRVRCKYGMWLDGKYEWCSDWAGSSSKYVLVKDNILMNNRSQCKAEFSERVTGKATGRNYLESLPRYLA